MRVDRRGSIVWNLPCGVCAPQTHRAPVCADESVQSAASAEPGEGERRDGSGRHALLTFHFTGRERQAAPTEVRPYGRRLVSAEQADTRSGRPPAYRVCTHGLRHMVCSGTIACNAPNRRGATAVGLLRVGSPTKARESPHSLFDLSPNSEAAQSKHWPGESCREPTIISLPPDIAWPSARAL